MLRLMQWAFIISWAFTIHNRNRQMMESRYTPMEKML